MPNMKVTVPHEGAVYPGAGDEPCVTNPKHVSGQTDVRPNYETKSPMHGVSRSPSPKLPRNTRGNGPLD